MKKIIDLIKKIISNNTLRVLKFNREEVMIFILLYCYESNPSEDLQEAMQILQANNEFWDGHNCHEFLLFGREIKSLARMCNDYSLEIAAQYGEGQDIFNSILSENYRLSTDLMLKTA